MSLMSLTEADICDQHITPALQRAGWDLATQVRREVTFTAGRIRVRGKIAVRGEKRRADYVLYFGPNLPIAIIEAKEAGKPRGVGLQQALAYAETLDVPFAFSSNGDGFVIHDRTGLTQPAEAHLALDAFPTPQALWDRYRAWKGLNDEGERLVRFPFHDDGAGREPRYYQRIAVQRAVEAVARGERRILLTMATGTGKTYTAFQIIWRLWKAGRVKRVLFLADRNILVDQTLQNDFKPFGQVATKVKDRQVDKSYEVYLALYQAVSGTEEADNIYRQFSPEFFDLIVIDECHRGSAREDSAWREILSYFQGAIHLGLTATPKETREVSTLTYFGEPLYTYSLKQGINDGFLAPYKVVRIDLDRDLQGWRPGKGMVDDHGRPIEDRVYNQRDMDKVLVLNERTRRVAQKIVEYLLGTDPYGKTIVFCEDIDHAERMRQALVNEIGRRYPQEAGNLSRLVSRITGDSPEGKASLYDFTHPEKRYPVIATTSKLLTTGVDIKTCKLIVLDQRIESMIEFKQIVGRGTRVLEEAGKLWFTLMDFKKATELFADPNFDGDPVIIYEPSGSESPVPPDSEDNSDGGDGDPGEDGGTITDPPTGGHTKYVVSDVTVSVLAERIQYYGPDGRLITESLKDYTRAALRERYESLEAFLRHWGEAERKTAVLEELTQQGVPWVELAEQVGQGLDPFDLVCHVVYDRPPLTRRERARAVQKRDVFNRYGERARAVLDALLEKYADEGIDSLENAAVLRVSPLNQLGTPKELVGAFGGAEAYRRAVRELEVELYRSVG